MSDWPIINTSDLCQECAGRVYEKSHRKGEYVLIPKDRVLHDRLATHDGPQVYYMQPGEIMLIVEADDE